MRYGGEGGSGVKESKAFSRRIKDHYIGSIDPWWTVGGGFKWHIDPHPVECKLRQESAALPSGWPVGFEQHLIESGVEFSAFPIPAVPMALPWLFSVSIPPSASFYANRRHSELAAFKAWEYLSGGLTVAGIKSTHSALGLSGQFRSHRMSVLIAREGPRIDYLHAHLIDERVDALIRHVNDNPLKLAPLHLAVTAMMDFLIIHPFEDGNGRMARLMFQWTLARHGILTKPILPLLPAIRKGRAPHLLAIYNWEFANDPLPLFEFVCHAVEPTLMGLQSFIGKDPIP